MAPPKFAKSGNTSTASPRHRKGRSKSTPAIPQVSRSTGQDVPPPKASFSPNSATSKKKLRHDSAPSVIPTIATLAPTVPVRPRLLKRFYEALVILFILGRSRGEPTAEESDLDEEFVELRPTEPTKLRRPFIRHLAYLCDYETGGDTVTAIALEQNPQNIVYHIASNKLSETTSPEDDRAKTFLQEVLDILRRSQPETTASIESEIFTKAVNFSHLRIKTYAGRLRCGMKLAFKHLAAASDPLNVAIRSWLQALEPSLDNLEELCQACYNVRRSSGFHNLTSKCATQTEPNYENGFQLIRHNIGRLNHTLKAVKVIVSTSIQLPDLFHDVEVKRAPSSTKEAAPLQERNPSLIAIIGRMLTDTSELEKHRNILQDFDRMFNLTERLHDQCTDKNWKPRVHAELILANLFWTQDLNFVANDRYIGCSKPACYSCYEYLAAHPGRFVRPACHNNNYLNWKPPDILSDDPNVDRLVEERERILNEMVGKIRLDALRQIVNRRGPSQWRPDSLTEISAVPIEVLDLNSLHTQEVKESMLVEERNLRESSLASSVAEYDGSSEALNEYTSEDDETDSDGGVNL